MGMLVEGSWLADDEAFRRSKEGAFIRPQASFRRFVTADGSSGLPAESGRYHLYAALSCPWAHRALIMRSLKGLEDCISLSVVAPWTTGFGWSFIEFPGATRDHVNNFEKLYQVYQKADPNYTGRVTVPVLWDKKTETIVSNESADIFRMFNSEFNAFARDASIDFYPQALRVQIDEINDLVYRTVNHGVYRAGFATSQEKYEEAAKEVFATLDLLENRLERRRYLCGDQLTEADWRLFTTLIRFDSVYYLHFKCNVRRLVDFRHLSGFTRELYQIHGIAATVNFSHIKNHYYRSHQRLNPGGLVPIGPDENFDMPHRREQLSLLSA